MSRLGKQPIAIPQGVEVTVADGIVSVKGPKGTLTKQVSPLVTIDVKEGEVIVMPKKEMDAARAMWGTFAAHVRNMVKGVTEGFTKQLEIEGVGYRAEAQGNNLKLAVGFSHPVLIPTPEGITLTVEKNLITVTGPDKEIVGQFAADIRKVKKPEPYKGKGIHYMGEYIIRKQGKKAV
jgi:large subunit ribosomal protein L6